MKYLSSVSPKNNLCFKEAQLQQLQQEPNKLPERDLSHVQIPDIYRISAQQYKTEGVVDKVKKFDLMSLVHPWLEHPFLMLGTCFGLSWGVDKFSEACSGEYEKSLVGKAARFGDKIQNSSFVKSSPMQAVIQTTTNIKNKIANVFKNSDLINAIRKTPSQPEWPMVKDELLNMQQRVVHDFTRVTDTLKLTSDEAVKLKDLGLTKGDNKFIKAFFNGIEKNEQNIVNAVQLKRLGLEDDAIRGIIGSSNASSVVKAKTIEKLGLSTEFIQGLAKKAATPDDIIKIREACNKAKNVKIGVGHIDLLGPFQPIARKIGFDEIGNRLVSMGDHVKHTKLGRAFASFLQRCHRGFTFGGGKGGVLLFVTPLIVEAMINVKRAEPKEKVATAVHDGTHAISWVFTFPLAVKLMHMLGGMQYAGMSPEKVAEYRKLISEFNEKVKSGVFKTSKEYNLALKELKFGVDGKGGLKALKTVKGQNLLTKICKKLASFMTMDLETIKPYKDSNVLMNVVRKVPNFMKNVAGVPLRFIIWGALSIGVFDTIINKTIKLFFGDFRDGIKEQEHRDNRKAQRKFTKEDLYKRLQEVQYEKNPELYSQEALALAEYPQGTQLEEMANSNQNEEVAFQKQRAFKNNGENIKSKINSSAELNNEKTVLNQEQSINSTVENVDEYTIIPNETSKITSDENEIVDNYTYIPSQESNIKILNVNKTKQDNYTYLPSSENKLNKVKPEDIANKYIPSQEGAKISRTFDNSGLDAALRRADMAEQKAFQILAGKFEGI